MVNINDKERKNSNDVGVSSIFSEYSTKFYIIVGDRVQADVCKLYYALQTGFKQ